MIIFARCRHLLFIDINSNQETCNGTEFHGLCYWSISQKLTFLNANSKCGENNGKLAEIPSHRSNSFVSTNLTVDSNYTWIGIRYTTSRGYVDMHDMKLKFTKWKRIMYYTFNFVTSSHCVVMKSKMNAVNCGYRYVFLCSLPKESNGSIEIPCQESMFAMDGKCFWRSNVSMTFWEAERECQIHGGHLASVPDNETMEFFKFQLSEMFDTPKATWIGIRYVSKNETYLDIFNRTQNFTDWEANEPSVIVRQLAKYVSLRKQDSGWYTFPYNYLYPAVCSRRTACRGSELPLNVSTQLLHPFSDLVDDMVFEFGTEIKLRHGRLLIPVVCLPTGFWKTDNTTGCLCPCERVPLLDNKTSVAQKIVKIKQELLLKKDELSTIKRGKTSALDVRTSAFALGSMLGIGVITSLVLVIAISDLPVLVKQIKLWHRKISPG